jgi:hypothetical protein
LPDYTGITHAERVTSVAQAARTDAMSERAGNRAPISDQVSCARIRAAAEPAPARLGQGKNHQEFWSQLAALDRGRVKRRSPTITEQFTVVARAAAWRIFRILYPKSNRIACFREGGEFSHGLDPLRSLIAGDRDGEKCTNSDLRTA